MGLIDRYINSKVTAELAKQQLNSVLRSSFNGADMLNLLNGYNLPTLDGDTHDYYNAFKTIGSVYECTDLIAKKINTADIIIYRVKDAKKLKESKKIEKSNPVQSKILKAQSIEEVDHYEISKLLEKPNEYMNRTQFIWNTALMYMLHGNCFVYGNKVNKKPKQLVPLAKLNIIADVENLLDPIRGYEYIVDGLQFAFEPDEIYHAKTANPRMISRDFQYLYGVSPLAAYLEPMRTIEEANKQASKQMKNGGLMQLISPTHKDEQWNTEQREAFKEALVSAKRSNGDIARLIPSTTSISVSDIGLSSAELQLIEQKKASSADIYRAFHVPLQYLSSDSSSYNNQSTAVKQLIYDAVSPVANAISEMLTNFVGKAYGDFVIEIDLTTLPEMAVDMEAISKFMFLGYEIGVFSQDEVRTALNYGELGTPESQLYEYKKRQLNTNTNNEQTDNQNGGQ